MSKIKKYFFYTSMNKRDLMYFRNEIDGIFLNGNVFFHFSEENQESILANNVSFILDPMLYMFQAQPGQLLARGQDKIKPSIIKLFKEYGFEKIEVINENLLNQKLEGSANILLDIIKDHFKYSHGDVEKIILNYSKLSISYQKNMMQMDKKMESILLTQISKQHENKNIMLPQLVPNSSYAIELNKKIIKKFKLKTDILPIYLDKESIDSNNFVDYIDMIKENLACFKDQDELRILLWVEKSKKNDFENVVHELINKFPNLRLLVKFGNYAEMKTCEKLEVNLEMWINAFGYGEERKIFPIGGGIPTNKVYSPIQHKRLNFPEYFEELKEQNIKNHNEYIDKYCSCFTCQEILYRHNDIDGIFEFASVNKPFKRRGRQVVTASFQAQRLSSRHFVYNKIIEMKKYGNLRSTKNSLWSKVSSVEK